MPEVDELDRLERLNLLGELQDEQVERLLALRAIELARPLDLARATRESADLVAFEIGGGRFAVPSATVAEVRPAGKLAALPGAPPHVRAVTAYRGRLLGVVDLARLFRAGEGPASPPLLVIVSQADGHLALACEQLHGLRPLLPGTLSAAVSLEARLTVAVRRVDAEGFTVLDVAGLFQLAAES